METVDDSVAELCRALSPLSEQGFISGVSELVETEVLADFHAATVLFIRAMRNVGRSATRSFQDLAEAARTEEESANEEAIDLVVLLDSIGISVSLDKVQQWSKSWCSQAYDFAESVGTENQLPKPVFLP
jgi:hypothetical protein